VTGPRPAPADVTYTLDGDVALIALDRPAKRNALREDMFAKLGEYAQRAGEEARVAILYGRGDHFCAGLDLAETAELLANGEPDRRRVRRHPPHAAFDWIARGSVPFIAALSGAVVGAGLEVAASAHIRVADPLPSSRCRRASAVSSSVLAARSASSGCSASPGWLT
jgi:enoyl-CoA hydratase/carnithine racemase